MATEPYVILRIPTSNDRGAHEGRFTHAVRQTDDVGRRFGVDISDLSLADVRDARREPGTLIARAGIPLVLIEPVSTDHYGAASASPAEDGLTWGLRALGVTDATPKGQGVRVAVLDTGLDAGHPAFAGLAGHVISRNFTQGDPADVRDTHGHGTHCAGTICGGSVSGTRIGVAPGIDRLIVGKVLGPGGGSNARILQAIQWAAAEHGAHVISMSLGIDFPGWVAAVAERKEMPLVAATSVALRDYRDTVTQFGMLADYLLYQGALLVAATGNESNHPRYGLDVSPPAAAEHVVAVGAIGESPDGYTVAPFSNTGGLLCAPGVQVVSARAGTPGLTAKSGTSMATPHVAGAAAVWLQWLRQNGRPDNASALRAKLESEATYAGMASPRPPSTVIGAGCVTVPRM